MAPIVLLRLFRADGDFNQATPHPADPIKCRTSSRERRRPKASIPEEPPALTH